LARDLGCRELTLDSWAANESAHRLFEAAGLTQRRHHYGKPVA
jgi:hypothetical protein